MKRTNRQKRLIRNSICALSLVVSLLITGIWAFLSASDEKTNTVTLGDINIELVEDGWELVSDRDSINFGYYVSTDGSSADTIPGETIEKAPYIVNTGKNDAWTYLIVKVPALSEEEFANSRKYIESYGAKYKIKTTAIGVQDGLLIDNNTIETSEDVWNAYYGETTSLFDEEPATGTRREAVIFNNMDNTNWEELMVYKGVKHNYHVYGYKTLIKGSKTLNSELAAYEQNNNQTKVNEITAILNSGEYEKTTALYNSFYLDSLFGSGYSHAAIKATGGCLYYIDNSPDAGCDEDGHPYRYTFYDEEGNELKEEEIFISNHKIKKYKVDVPKYYEDKLKAGTMTLAEYNAVPKTPVKDKYYVTAATESNAGNKWTLININKTGNDLKWSTEASAASPATYPLNIYVKEFLNNNNITSRYYNVSGDTWTLKGNAVNGNSVLGAGKFNTKFIFDFYGTENTTFFADNTVWGALNSYNNTDASNTTGCNDWYIPSLEELELIKDAPNSPITTFNSFWAFKNCITSSEYNTDCAYIIDSYGHTYTEETKWYGEANVFVVRSF